MLKIKLPKDLENEYYEINSEYGKIRDDWKKYNDEIIPEDKDFAKRIIRFIIQVIEYTIKNYEKLDIQKYQEFLILSFCMGIMEMTNAT